MKKFLAFLLLLCIGIFSCACDKDPTDLSNTQEMVILDTKGTEWKIEKLKCTTKVNENIKEDYTSFYDDTYNYFVFKSGRIYNVALDGGDRDYYFGFEEKEIEFKLSKITSSAVKEITNTILQKSNNRNYSVSESFKYSQTAKVDIGFASAESKLELGISATQAWGFSSSSTISNSYETCTEEITEETETIKLKYTTSYPVGYYLYTLIGDIDVYNAVVINRTTKEFEVYSFSSIVRSNRQLLFLGEDLEYSNEPMEPLSFNVKDYEDILIKEPIIDISNYQPSLPIENQTEISVVYTSSKVLTIHDNDTNDNPCDTISLKDLFGVSLETLSEAGFKKLQWDIKIGIKELDKGFQEMYLGTSIYVDKDNRKKSPLWSEEKYEFNGGNKGSCIYTVPTFILDVSDCADVMYMSYSANGSLGDTWQRTSITITIKAYK